MGWMLRVCHVYVSFIEHLVIETQTRASIVKSSTSFIVLISILCIYTKFQERKL